MHSIYYAESSGSLTCVKTGIFQSKKPLELGNCICTDDLLTRGSQSFISLVVVKKLNRSSECFNIR